MESDRRHDEKVAGDDVLGVVGQERFPFLRRRLVPFRHIVLDGRLADVVAEFQQLPVNLRGAPGWILVGHLSYQQPDFSVDFGTTRFSMARFPSPKQFETFPMPSDNGLGFDDDERFFPAGRDLRKKHPEDFSKV